LFLSFCSWGDAKARVAEKVSAQPRRNNLRITISPPSAAGCSSDYTKYLTDAPWEVESYRAILGVSPPACVGSARSEARQASRQGTVFSELRRNGCRIGHSYIFPMENKTGGFRR